MINDYSLVKHTFKNFYNANTIIFNVCLAKHFCKKENRMKTC